MELLAKLDLGLKFTDGTGTPYYISGFKYDLGLLDLNKKIIGCKISQVSDKKYICEFPNGIILKLINEGSWKLI